ncbi:MAG: phenylacetate--CoA ligase family protein [Burkholderiales bacterium]
MSGLYTTLIAHGLFPLQERFKHHSTVAVRREMERVQWLPRAEIEELQARRLRAFIADITTHVPYYRDLFAGRGMSAADIRTPADLGRLPLLTKGLIRAHADALRADDARRLARFNTGGSSGEPLVFYIGAERVSHDVAAKWRATRWWNVDIGDPEIVVWGSPIELGAQDRVRALRDAVMRTELLPAFEMSDAKLDHFLERIRARRPRMLFGYPTAIAIVARHARRRGVRMDDLGIAVAFVTAEQLLPDQASTIAAIFGCPVANGYGGRDAGFIAHACPHGGLHVTADDIVVETIDSNGRPVGPGVAGEIVVTHLATRDFPFVRYRTGDLGMLSEATCPCGRGLPLLHEVTGRTTDMIVAADGSLVHGLGVVYPIRELPGIEAFKVIQETRTQLRVLVVASDAYTRREEERMITGLRARLGASVGVTVERVAAIPPERSGKYRYVQSRVAATEPATASPVNGGCAGA